MKTCRTCKNHHDVQHFGHWCYAVGVPVDPNQNRNKCCDYIEDENICVTCGHKMIGTIHKGKPILGCPECGNYENIAEMNMKLTVSEIATTITIILDCYEINFIHIHDTNHVIYFIR